MSQFVIARTHVHHHPVIYMTQTQTHQSRQHVQRNLLRRARAHPRRTAHQLRRRLQKHGVIARLQKRRPRIVRNTDHRRAPRPRHLRRLNRERSAAARRNRNHRVARRHPRKFRLSLVRVVVRRRRSHRRSRHAARHHNANALARDAESAAEFHRVHRRQHSGRARTDIPKHAARPQSRRHRLRTRADRAQSLLIKKRLRRLYLRVSQKRRDLGDRQGVKPRRRVMQPLRVAHSGRQPAPSASHCCGPYQDARPSCNSCAICCGVCVPLIAATDEPHSALPRFGVPLDNA